MNTYTDIFRPIVLLFRRKMDPVAELLETHISIRSMPDNENRVKCILTGHEMAKTEQAINQYVNGKRYKRLSKPCVKAANGKAFFYEDYRTFRKKISKIFRVFSL